MRPSCQFRLSMVMIGNKRGRQQRDAAHKRRFAMNLAQASASTVARDIRSPVLWRS